MPLILLEVRWFVMPLILLEVKVEGMWGYTCFTNIFDLVTSTLSTLSNYFVYSVVIFGSSNSNV